MRPTQADAHRKHGMMITMPQREKRTEASEYDRFPSVCLPTQHIASGEAGFTLGLLAESMELQVEAQRLFSEALAVYTQNIGAEHASTVSVREALARVGGEAMAAAAAATAAASAAPVPTAAAPVAEGSGTVDVTALAAADGGGQARLLLTAASASD